MRYFRYLFLIFILSIMFINNINAEVCNADEIKRLKEIANNVTVTYDYDEERDENGIYGYYLVTVSGLTEEIYGQTSLDNEIFRFHYSSENGGVDSYNLFSDIREINIYSSKCDDKKLRTLKLDYPYYNIYHTYSECENISGDDLYVCGKFTDKKISYSTFMNEINKYNKSDKKKNDSDEFLVNFIKKYFYIVIVGVIVLILFIIRLIRFWKNKHVLD